MASPRINLLSPEALRAYQRHRRQTVLTRTLIAFNFLAAILLVFLITAMGYLAILTKSEEERLTVIRRSEEFRKAETLEGNLRAFANDLKTVRLLEKPQYDPAVIVRQVVEAQSAGARLHALNLFLEAPVQNGDGQKVFLSGKAGTRGDVLDFQHALEILPFVASVEAPLANIIHPVDPEFSFSVTLKPLSETP
ncbi:MAG: hypothetical protein HY475_02855 [Candidatus Terrybacteria bacterium]|nr:hypothetical protein [Candidatus Terrybacteria bacterium]